MSLENGLRGYLDRTVSRRGLGREAAGATAAAVGALALPGAAEAATETLPLHDLAEFERLGIGEFHPLYAMSGKIKRIWGTTIQFGQLFAGFDKPLTMHSPEVRTLRDGWGIKTDQEITTEAQKKVDDLDIDTTEAPEIDKNEGKKIFRGVATLMPRLIILGMPSKIRIFHVSPTDHMYGYTNELGEMGVAAESLADPTSGPVTAFHEASHRAEAIANDILKNKAYLNKSTLLKFYETQLRAITETAEDFFSADWDTAQSNNALGNDDYAFSDEGISEVAQATQLVTAYFPGLMPPLDTRGMTTEQIHRLRYNQITWAIGKKLLQMDRENITDPGSLKFKNLSIVKAMADRTLKDIGHYFTGPVQKIGGGIPVALDAKEIGDIQNPIIFRNIEVQRAKITAFSVYPQANRIEDVAKAFQLETQAPKEIQTETYENLVKFDAEYIGTRAYEGTKRLSVYKLPGAASFSDKNYYYIEYIEANTKKVAGHMVALKKGVTIRPDFEMSATKMGRSLQDNVPVPAFTLRASDGYSRFFFKNPDGSFGYQNMGLRPYDTDVMDIKEAPKVTRLNDGWVKASPLLTDTAFDPAKAHINTLPENTICSYRVTDAQELELYPITPETNRINTFQDILSLQGDRNAIIYRYTDINDKKQTTLALNAMMYEAIQHPGLDRNEITTAGANIQYKGDTRFSVPGVPWDLVLSPEYAQTLKLLLTESTDRAKQVSFHAMVVPDFRPGDYFDNRIHHTVLYYIDVDFYKFPFTPSFPEIPNQPR